MANTSSKPFSPASDSSAEAATRPYRGVSGEQRQQQRRARLVAAGLSVFATRGFAATGVRDICRTAELSNRYFYESFNNLDELFAAVYRQVNADLAQTLMTTLGRGQIEPSRIVEEALRTYYTFLSADKARGRILLVEALASGQASYERIKDVAGMFNAFMNAMYPDDDKLGIDSHLILYGLLSYTVGLATEWINDGYRRSIDEMLRNNLVPFQAVDDWYKRKQG